MFNKIINKIDNEWFFSEPGPILKFLHVYIKGDLLGIIPFWVLFIVTAFFSWQFLVLELGLFLCLRGFGEMIYWLFQQFSDRSYRPSTPYKKLDNNAVYIIYQLSGMRNALLGALISVIALVLIFVK